MHFDLVLKLLAGNSKTPPTLIFSFYWPWILTLAAGENSSQKYGDINQHQLLWKPPEFLRYATPATLPSAPTSSLASLAISTAVVEPVNFSEDTIHCNFGSQKGDVYSFGLVLYEIMGRKGPWGKSDLRHKDVACKFSFTKSVVYFDFENF